MSTYKRFFLAAVGWIGVAIVVVLALNTHPKTQAAGIVRGVGTFFAVSSSTYLNVTLNSSEPVSVQLSSVPQMVTVSIHGTTGATTTMITMKGFAPAAMYYKYQDNYHNGVQFSTDPNGTYTYVQDVSAPHTVFIQPTHSTKFLVDNATGGDCGSVGTWQAANKTCTLTVDMTETIEIDSDNITLDGAHHAIVGHNTGNGILAPGRNNVVVKNVNISQFSNGVYLLDSTNSTVTGNSITAPGYGVFSRGDGNIVGGNNFPGVDNGFVIGYSYGVYIEGPRQTVASNTISYAQYGIFGFSNSASIIRQNSVSNSGSADLLISSGSGNMVRDNTLFGGLFTTTVGLYIDSGGEQNAFFHNNISDHVYNVYAFSPVEVSSNGEGNFWGHMQPPCFHVAGGPVQPFDSNRGDVVDSHAICQMYGLPAIASGTLQQYMADGVTPLSEGTTTTQDTVVFGAFLQSSAPNQLRLEVEYTTSTTFSGVANASSSSFAPGTQATIFVQHVPGGSYRWHARVVDIVLGSASSWQEFGMPGNIDFIINTIKPVVIDIRPHKFPNTITLCASSSVPTAVFGSSTFDVHTLDIATVKLANAPVSLKGNGQPMLKYKDDNNDGILDVILRFSVQALGLTPNDTKADLTGQLTSGVQVKGSDSVQIIQPRVGHDNDCKEGDDEDSDNNDDKQNEKGSDHHEKDHDSDHMNTAGHK